MKIETFKELAATQDGQLLQKVLVLFHKEKEPITPPCQFTVKELKSEILKSEEAIKQGRIYTMEEMRAKHPKP